MGVGLSFSIADCSNSRVINYIRSESTQLDERDVVGGLEQLVGSEELFKGALEPLVVKSLRRVGRAGQVKQPYRLIS